MPRLDDRELAARLACVMKALAAFGITDEARTMAMVRLTSGIPWYVPPIRGEDQGGPPRLLFAAAVARAALEKEFGAPGPGDVLKAAIEIGGRLRSDQGHTSERAWVRAARSAPDLLGISEDELRAIPPTRSAGQIAAETWGTRR